MAKPKPWVAINAQNRVIGRYEKEEDGLTANSDLLHVQVLYRPRAKKRTARTFP